MIVVLPPSETKRDGGAEGSALDLAALSFPSLSPRRREALSALRALSRNRAASVTALGLSAAQAAEVDRNRAVRSSPLLPAIERYTGVLYDGLAVQGWDDAMREHAARILVIQSALFGPIGALDPIPAYRLSHDSRLPELPLKKHWREPSTAALATHAGLVVDLRSEVYAALGPAPKGSVYVRVVTEGADGRRKALSHFNKKAKGEFARALVADAVDAADAVQLCDWAARVGIRLEPGAPGELDLVV